MFGGRLAAFPCPDWGMFYMGTAFSLPPSLPPPLPPHPSSRGPSISFEPSLPLAQSASTKWRKREPEIWAASSGDLFLSWKCMWSKVLAVQLFHAGVRWRCVDREFSPGWEEEAELGLGSYSRDRLLHSYQVWSCCFAEMQLIIEPDSWTKSLFLPKRVRNEVPAAALGCLGLIYLIFSCSRKSLILSNALFRND